jgi:hypothetical protein
VDVLGERQGHVDARGHAGAADVRPLSDDAVSDDLQSHCAQVVAEAPVRGRLLSFKQTGGGVEARAGAYRCRPLAVVREYGAHDERHGFGVWAVIEQASGALIGDAGLYLLEGRGPDAELGYTLGRAWRGRTSSPSQTANAAPTRVPQKAGMRQAGTWQAHGRPHAIYVAKRSGRRANWPAQASEQK